MSSAKELSSSALFLTELIGGVGSETPSKSESLQCSAVPAFLAIRITVLMICAVIFIPTSATFGNDTIARVGAGGITFLKTQDIRILEEVLWISPELIRVKYRFLNESHHDIHATVAFPLPTRERDPGGMVQTSENIRKSFVVRVNGNQVSTSYRRKAVISNREITSHLRRAGLSEKEIFDTFAGYEVDRADRISWSLPLGQQEELRRLMGELTRGNSPWKVAETLFWEQVFPSRRELVVEHAYTPMAGGRFESLDTYEFGDITDLARIYFLDETACLDRRTKRGITNRIRSLAAKGVRSTLASERDVEYVLGTGRNWKGPIGLFKLRIEKTDANQFVSLCFPGKPKKISSTVFEFVERNFIPPDRLVVNFYKIGPEP